MTLSDLASLGSFASGVAVSVSLIYLILQTRQNVRHTRALIVQGASARTTAIALATLNRDVMANWVEGNGGSPDEVKQALFAQMCQTSITALEDILSQRTSGLMQDEVFARNCIVHQGLLSQPGMRAYWNAQRVELGKVAPKFVAFVDALCVGEATHFTVRL